MYERILVCLDNSERAASVAHAAADLAARYEAHALLLCVHEAPEPDKMPYSALSAQSVISHNTEQLQQRAREASEIFRERGVLFDVWHRTATPVDSILKTAKEQCVDLIVMGGAEPKKGWQWLRKSTVEQVSRYAPCTVMHVADAAPRSQNTGILIGGLGREAWGNLSLSE